MYHFISLIATILLAVNTMSLSDGQNFLINSTCSETTECWTLSEFAANISQIQYNYFSNASAAIILDPGKHILAENLTISSIITLHLTSSSSSYAKVVCENNTSFHFSDAENIYISSVHFLKCGGNSVENVTELVLKDAKFYGNNSSGSALQLIETTATITDCDFSFNTRGTLTKIHLGDIVIPQVPHSDGIDAWVGAALMAINASLIVKNVHFKNNLADVGGAIFLSDCDAAIDSSTFVNNQQTSSDEGFSFGCINSTLGLPICTDTQITAGGALFLEKSNVSISNSTLCRNSASAGGAVFAINSELCFSSESLVCENNASTYDGGAIHAWYTTIKVIDSRFDENIVQNLDGGAIYCFSCNIAILNSYFSSNIANSEGGGLFLLGSSLTINGSEFTNNRADSHGGVLHIYHSRIMLANNQMISNTAITGAAMTIITCDTISDGFLEIVDNLEANISTSVHLLDSRFLMRGNFTFSNNHGSMMVFNTNVTFEGSLVIFRNNHQPVDSPNERIGGAITLFQSTITFMSDACTFEDNIAKNGGAIHSSQSKLFIEGTVMSINNSANKNGGSMYLDQSELVSGSRSDLTILNSTAAESGGGIHAVSTVIKVNASSNVTLCYNSAANGGALSLKTNSKVYVMKYTINDDNISPTLYFMGNSANYGGAIFVNDDTYAADACADSNMECFFQVFTLYYEVFLNHIPSFNLDELFNFQDNQAHVNGSSLFGGFLNRCTMSSFVGVDYGYNGSDYFHQISTGDTSSSSVSSRPVQVCTCDNENNPHCNHMTPAIEVMKGQAFNVSLVAIDQMGKPVKATIQSGLTFNESGLAEGQLRWIIPGECTELTFNVISSQNSEKLILYASDGPCKDATASLLILDIQFLHCSCPIGFQPSGNSVTNCTCECHSDVAPYVSKCDMEAESILRYSHSKAWISSILQDNTSDYLIYPNCPYDYCKSNEPVLLNLNHHDGSDAQCAYNHSLLLCGSCKAGLSLSLGSSRCLTCPSHWPVVSLIITLAAALAGIALVALLLLLNLTVAVGTLNGVIFYANIISANKSILLPFSSPNLVTVIISWLSLDIGFDTCYFKGMDAYAKSWLQLAFLAYMLLLVAAVIILSSASSRFSNFIGKRDPVATLATIILLSYATILENTFRALTPGKLVYPNRTIEIVWLPDATIKYLSGAHIPLFIVAILILIIGLIYTILLFSWQWLLRLPKWKIFKWIRNQRLHTFIETYSIPYTPRHRYWTGLLLLARAFLYLIAAANISNDPQLRLTSIIFIVCGIIFLKSLAGHRLYKDSFIDIVEMIFYFNILAFATLTWYAVNSETAVHYSSIIAHVSIIITLILLALIIIYHLNTYTTLLSRITVYQKLLKTLTLHESQQLKAGTALPLTGNNSNEGDGMDRFNELMDVMECSISNKDNPLQNVNVTAHSGKPTEPTCSTVVAISELEDTDDAINSARLNEQMNMIEDSHDHSLLQSGTAYHDKNTTNPAQANSSSVVIMNETKSDVERCKLNEVMEESGDHQLLQNETNRATEFKY